MKILNLYAGLGGNRLKWPDTHEITAVESDPTILQAYKAQFPNDTCVQGDAHEFLRLHHGEYGFIWSSPPCQSHTRMMKATRHKQSRYPDLRLYEEILFLRNFHPGGKWVVENVTPYYEPLTRPTQTLGRHLFWANFHISQINAKSFPGMITAGTLKEAENLKEWLGIRYGGSIYYKGNHCPGQVLRNCVHPDLGLHVLNEALNPSQPSLFRGL